MLNAIWLGMIIIAAVFAVIDHRIPQVVASVTESAKFAFQLALGLTGLMAFWLGLMKIAEEAGMVQAIGRMLRPIMKRLFPEVPSDHPAMGAMVFNIAANMLGIGNAATPLGIKAMKELDSINDKPGIASNAMCTFLAINTSSVQLIPVTAIAYLAAAGASNPTNIIVTSLIATSFSTVAAIIAVKFLQRLPRFHIDRQASVSTDTKKLEDNLEDKGDERATVGQ